MGSTKGFFPKRWVAQKVVSPKGEFPKRLLPQKVGSPKGCFPKRWVPQKVESLLNRLLADLTIQSISSKSYVNPHIVGKTKKPNSQIPNLYIHIYIYICMCEDFCLIGGGGAFINRGNGLAVCNLMWCHRVLVGPHFVQLQHVLSLSPGKVDLKCEADPLSVGKDFDSAVTGWTVHARREMEGWVRRTFRVCAFPLQCSSIFRPRLPPR